MKRMFTCGLKGLSSFAAPRIPTAPLLSMLAFAGFVDHAQAAFDHPTYASPIALSADNRLVWSVNPDDNSVSVIATDTNQVISKIGVGNEPQSVALDSDNKYAYVANAADGTVALIKINNPDPSGFSARVKRTLRTGAEPWNIVVSPDGQRVFVANSGQDTITVIDGIRRKVIGAVNLRDSPCNDPDRNRHFQPRGLAVTQDNSKLYVTRFFSFTKAGGVQADDNGREGLVCRLDINTQSRRITDYKPVSVVRLPVQPTGFNVDSNGDGVADATSAFPNQLQSIVIRGDKAYLPNIAASPTGPLRFNVSTQAFVNLIGGVNGPSQTSLNAINLHLGARNPEAGKKRLFFASPWAIAFTSQNGAGTAYAVSAGSDLLVKVSVDANGILGNTVDADTTRYIDLNDPGNAATSGDKAGKNPRGIVITDDGTRAYVMNFVSRNVSVVDLTNDAVIDAIRTTPLPTPGSPDEEVQVGAEMFFSSRGHFDRPAGTAASTDERLSSEGWQSCSSCHFQGLTDSIVWSFGAGPRKSVPLNGSFNPHDPNNGQRVLNYSAIFDEVEDFDLNARNVSGPGSLATAVSCNAPPPDTSTFDPNHGLLIGDNGAINTPPCVINAFAKANAGRQEATVTLPGSSTVVPALTALRQWVQFAVRTPGAPLYDTQVKGGVSKLRINKGRRLFAQAGCTDCHAGDQWTVGIKDFTSPPSDAAEGFTQTERTGTFSDNPVAVQYLNRFLKDIGSFNIGVAGEGNLIGGNIGAVEKAAPNLTLVNGNLTSQPPQDALGRDYNNDGRGNGFNVPSLLGVHASPPYLHNGACETLACVVSDVNHRTAKGTRPDVLSDPRQQAWVVLFLESITDKTRPFPLPPQ